MGRKKTCPPAPLKGGVCGNVSKLSLNPASLSIDTIKIENEMTPPFKGAGGQMNPQCHLNIFNPIAKNKTPIEVSIRIGIATS
jgi:hypothetical protein